MPRGIPKAGKRAVGAGRKPLGAEAADPLASPIPEPEAAA